MPRHSTRQKPRGLLREASTRKRRLTKKKQALLDQQSYDPQVDTLQQSKDEQSQNGHHSSSPTSLSSPSSQQLSSNMFNHDYPQDKDTNIDHPSDSSGTEIHDMWQYHDQNASHTVSEHASVALLLASPARTPSLTPLERSASPSPSPAPAPPSQVPVAKVTHRFQNSSRAQKNASKQAKKPALKRTTNKRKGEEPVVRAARRQKRVKWVESAVTVSNDHDGDHEDGYGDEYGVGDHDDNDDDENENEDEDEDNASEHSLAPETPMPGVPPALMPHSHLHFLAHHVHMAPPPHFLPGLDPYLHSRMAYHDLQAARDILFFQYNAAAREAVAKGEPWGFLWFNSDYMEQSAASALVEFKRLSLAPAPVPTHVVPMHPVVVPHSHLQPELHAHCDGCAECYY